MLDLIKGDETVWEQEPLRDLSVRNELKVFLHHSFWQPMDTMRDKIILETLWAEEKHPGRSGKTLARRLSDYFCNSNIQPCRKIKRMFG